MQQIIIGGYDDDLSMFESKYNSLAGGAWWDSAIDATEQCVSTPGTLKNLFIELSAAPGDGQSTTFTVMKNEVATALTVTVADTATTGSDVAHEVAVVAGDVICLRATTFPPHGATARWSIMFEGTNAKESLILGIGYCDELETRYNPISHGASESSATENETYQVIPTSGTIKNLYINLDEDAGAPPEGYRFTLRKNGVSTLLTVTVTANAKTGNDVAHEIAVVAGDYVDLMIEPLNNPSTSPAPWPAWGMTFVADTDGESLILGQSKDNPATGATEYHYLTTTNYNALMPWTATEADRYQGGQVTTLKKLYVKLSAAPGGGNSYQLQPRVNVGNSGISVTISNLDTTGNDVVNTDVLANFDDLAISCTPAGTPAAAMVYWGLVGYIEPPVAGWTGKISGVTNPAKVMGVEVANIAKVKGVA